MNNFVQWYQSHDDQITWWLIGFLSWGAIDGLSRGSYLSALVDVLLIAANYVMWKQRQ